MDRKRSCDRSCDVPWLSSDVGQESLSLVSESAARTMPAHNPGSLDSDSDNEAQEYEHAASAMERSMTSHESHESIEMPASIYGAAMALSFQAYYHTTMRDPLIKIQAAITFTACLIGISAQWFILNTVRIYLMRPAVIETRKLYQRFEDDYFDPLIHGIDTEKFQKSHDKEFQEKICQMPLANPKFCFIILAVWSGFAIIDVEETMKYVHAWSGMRFAKHGKPLATFDHTKHRFVMRRCSLPMRLVVIFLILMPKFIIAVVCWWVGCRWLIATLSYEEFLLNSVALAFVMDLDEMIYKCTVSRASQQWIEAHAIRYPGISKHREHAEKNHHSHRRWRISRNLFGMFVAWTLMVGAPIAYMHFQQMIPDYRWDVRPTCKAYYAEIFSDEAGLQAALGYHQFRDD